MIVQSGATSPLLKLFICTSSVRRLHGRCPLAFRQRAWWRVLLIAGSCSCALPAREPTHFPLAVEVGSSQVAVPWRAGVLAVNNEMLGKGARYSDERFQQQYLAAGRPLIRFPGGTGSNYFDWEAGHGRVKANASADARRRAERINQPALTDEFIAFARKTRAAFTVALNLVTVSADSNRRLMEKFRAAGVTVTHVEMGNELYFGLYEWAFADVEAYLAESRRQADAIRHVFPQVKVGVVIPSQLYTDEVFLEGGKGRGGTRIRDWYAAVAREARTSHPFFDAVVIHLYSSVGMDGQTPQSRFLPYEEAYRNATSHADARFRPVLQELETQYRGREVWVTEWHVGGFAGEVRNFRLRYSYLGALFAGDFLLKLAQSPSVTVGGWHAFIQWWGESRRSGGAPDAGLNNFHFFQLLQSALVRAKSLRPLGFQGIQGYAGSSKHPGSRPDVAGCLVSDQDGRQRLILINRQAKFYRLDTVKVDGAPAVVRVGEQIRPDSRLPMEQALREEARHERSALPAKLLVLLPPYSVSVVELGLP